MNDITTPLPSIRTRLWASFMAASLLLTACLTTVDPGTEVVEEEPDFSTVPAPLDPTGAPSVTLDNGVTYFVIRPGEGPFEVVYRDRISVFLTLRRTNGDIITSSYADSSIYPSNINVADMTVEGLKYGLIGMKVSEVRKIYVPPAMALADVDADDRNYYLRNDTLVYDVELVSIFE